MNGLSLVIRADASIENGTGHVMRCLAIAQAAQSIGLDPVFLTSKESAIVHSRLEAESLQVKVMPFPQGSGEDANWTAETARALNARWVVADGYHFGDEYQRIIKDHGLKLLFVDDYGHCTHYCADVILNQNIYADASLYPSREDDTALLLGTKYCLLRKEFYPFIHWQRDGFGAVGTVLVTFGGTDPAGRTLPVLQLLDRIESPLKVMVIAGAGNQRLSEIEMFAQTMHHSVEILSNVEDMPALMTTADMAISAAGSTVWELLFMQVPSVVTAVADNQVPIADFLGRNGLAMQMARDEDLSDPALVDKLKGFIDDATIRADMAAKGRQHVTGTGSFRVAACFDVLTLRPATEADRKWIWELANEPLVRKVSFSADPIPWETHVRWFEQKLSDENCLYYVAENIGGKTIGPVRFDLDGEDADISLSFVEEFRGKGYAVRLVREACTQCLNSSRVKTIHAYIYADNVASLKTFKRAGFTEISPVGERKCHFVMQRS